MKARLWIASIALAMTTMLNACHAPETKDRLPEGVMERMVATDMRIATEDGLPTGKAYFDKRLAKLQQKAVTHEDRIHIADMLMAFGVSLYIGNPSNSRDEEIWRRAALPYLKRAIPAYEAAFGADHPEVALALHSYPDAVIALSPKPPPRETIDCLQRSYDIRLAKLGRGDPETIAVHKLLASLDP